MTVPASSYNSLIPQATDQLNTSQSDLLNNFGALATWIDQDHVDSAAAGAGKHFRVTLPVQGSAPSFTGTDIGFYNFANTITSLQEITLNKLIAGGSAVQIPMTASILSTNATPASLSACWTYLPSGLLIKWAGSIAANGTTTITFPTGASIPTFTTCLAVYAVINNTGAGDVNQAITINSITPTNFVCYGSQRTATGASAVTFTYLAIGF